MSSAEVMRAFAEVIFRIGDLLSLASLLPVILACRFGDLRKRHIQSNQKKEQEQQQDKLPRVPLGFISTLLLIAAEALACRGVFFVTKGKGKATLGGPMGALVAGVGKGYKTVQTTKSLGFLDRVSTMVVIAFDQETAFNAVHGIAMLVALLTLSTAILGRLAFPVMKQCGRGACKHLFRLMALAVPVFLFGVLRWQTITKAWKMVQTEKSLADIRMFLRAAALIAATGPGSDEDGGTPAMFMVLQASSLVCSFWAHLATGDLASILKPFFENPLLTAAMDSSAMVTFLPIVLGLLWLVAVHLYHRPGPFMLTTLISSVSSPVVLPSLWASVASNLGLSSSLAPEKSLSQVVSIVYTLVFSSLYCAGGTVTFISTVLMVQLLLRIHGIEAWEQAFA
mmetsp:Transcript_78177/g.154956  ORF Transcript_78177/g.154956 Transcript_78177/m.154956 type:complete len:396 (-) Transcript_78177:45-1232(-)